MKLKHILCIEIKTYIIYIYLIIMINTTTITMLKKEILFNTF